MSREATQMKRNVNKQVREILNSFGFKYSYYVQKEINNIIKLEYLRTQKELKKRQKKYNEYGVKEYYTLQYELVSVYDKLCERSIDIWIGSVGGYVSNVRYDLKKSENVG